MEEIEKQPNSLELERRKFVESGWKQTDYASLFSEGSEASIDDFLGILSSDASIEGKMITIARHKTHSDTFIDIIYVKEGNTTPPTGAWSSREVYQVQDGSWKSVEKEMS